MFKQEQWVSGTTGTGAPIERATVPFVVDFLGQQLGVLDLEVTYAPNREASQANYTSLLHLGTLAPYFTAHDVTNNFLEINIFGSQNTLAILTVEPS